jgi:hypothetical protein
MVMDAQAAGIKKRGTSPSACRLWLGRVSPRNSASLTDEFLLDLREASNCPRALDLGPARLSVRLTRVKDLCRAQPKGSGSPVLELSPP